MFERAYLEITNVCGRTCSFCPGCSRPPRFLSLEEFETCAAKLRPFTDCLCLHVMGEPTLHPKLDGILSVCDDLAFRVILTTNGTLLKEKGEILLAHKCVYKVQISLHSFEADPRGDGDYCDYFENCFSFAARSSGAGIITVLRLWNGDGREKGARLLNPTVEKALKEAFPDGFWSKNKRGYCISPKLYLEYDERFVWPSPDGAVLRGAGKCHALSRQIAVLCDGTVVPCCLDGQGNMPLGNLFCDDLAAILSSPTAARMRDGFENGNAFAQPFCRTCGYADRFNRQNLRIPPEKQRKNG